MKSSVVGDGALPRSAGRNAARGIPDELDRLSLGLNLGIS